MPITSYYFWFTQPATLLSASDKMLIYIFFGLFAASFIFWIIAKLTKHTVVSRLLKKFWHLLFWTGLTGVIWGTMRYENTPIFARRYWAGLNLIIGILWLLYVLKYLIFNFRSEKSEYNRESVRSKYLPKSSR